MKTAVAVVACVLCAAAWLIAEPAAKSLPPDHYVLHVSLVDTDSGAALSGLMRFEDADGKAFVPEGLLPRGIGVEDRPSIKDWCVVGESTAVELPRASVQVTAFSGLEYESVQQLVTTPNASAAEESLTLKLQRFADAHADGWWNANTHVHLKKVSRGESDRYLLDVGRADGLDLVYVSYLERANEDVDYTTNRYSRAELQALSNRHVHFDHGEEHRHNFGGGDEGYGHVMLLAIPELVYPVSIGPGISKTGTDGLPLQRGIERAHDIGATVIWCHNAWGLEDIPNWLTGRLEANNIFDGGTHGSYHSSFYRYLDVGIKTPFSTGTDWFIYDFSRVYVPSKERPTSEEWLQQLAAGRSYITNGPLLEFSVAGQRIGDDVSLSAPGAVEVTGRVVGRVDFQRIELVQGGDVVATVASRAEGGHFVADLAVEFDIAQPCWLALRTPPPSIPDDPEHATTTPLNEYGRELFAHTSATFVDVGGRRKFAVEAARELLAEMQRNRAFIDGRGVFADESERTLVLSTYDEGIELIGEQIARAEQRPAPREN